MSWVKAERRHVHGTIAHRMFEFVRELAMLRAEHPAMSAGGDVTIHRHADTAVFAWALHHPRHGRFHGLANFADRSATVPVDVFTSAGLEQPRVVLGGESLVAGDYWFTIAPHAVVWVIDDADAALQPPVRDFTRNLSSS
jgi:hypothetical protein